MGFSLCRSSRRFHRITNTDHVCHALIGFTSLSEGSSYKSHLNISRNSNLTTISSFVRFIWIDRNLLRLRPIFFQRAFFKMPPGKCANISRGFLSSFPNKTVHWFPFMTEQRNFWIEIKPIHHCLGISIFIFFFNISFCYAKEITGMPVNLQSY